MNNQSSPNNQPGQLDPFYKELESVYKTIEKSDQAPTAKLGLLATRSLQLFEKNQERFKDNPAKMFSVLITNDEAWLTMQATRFSETLDSAVHTGKLRNVDTEKIGVLFLNSIFSLMIRRIHLPGNLPTTGTIEDDVRDLIDLYINGLAA